MSPNSAEPRLLKRFILLSLTLLCLVVIGSYLFIPALASGKLVIISYMLVLLLMLGYGLYMEFRQR